MAKVLTNGGFVSTGAIGGGVTNGGLAQYQIANSYGSSIFVGDLVKLATDGTIVRATTSTDKILGAFAGLNIEGQPDFKAKKYFAAGTSAWPGKVLTGMVISDPHAKYEVQADGSVTAGDVGANFNFVVGSGVAALGLSNSRVEAASRSDTAGQLKCVGLSPRADNSWADPYPYILVMINEGVHQLTTPSVA